MFADCTVRARSIFDFYHLQSPGLRCNDHSFFAVSVLLNSKWVESQKENKSIDFTGWVTYSRKISRNVDIYSIHLCFVSRWF